MLQGAAGANDKPASHPDTDLTGRVRGAIFLKISPNRYITFLLRIVLDTQPFRGFWRTLHASPYRTGLWQIGGIWCEVGGEGAVFKK